MQLLCNLLHVHEPKATEKGAPPLLASAFQIEEPSGKSELGGGYLLLFFFFFFAASAGGGEARTQQLAIGASKGHLSTLVSVGQSW